MGTRFSPYRRAMTKTLRRAMTVLMTLLPLTSLFLTAPTAFAQSAGVKGTVPAGMPDRLSVGLFEDTGNTWMRDSGAAWDVRYRYFTKGWVNNWGWSAADGSFGLRFMQESAAQGFLPAIQYYQLFAEPGGGESATLTKVGNASTMRSYFSDFKLLMQRARDFGQPVLVLVEADATGFLEHQSGHNPGAYAAVAATGLPELSGLPDTVAGWGLAFLQLKKAVGANNVIFGIHVSGWASGRDVPMDGLASLQAEVERVANFLRPLGLMANVTGLTYDVIVGDPLDRDADFFRLTQGRQAWWDASDDASLTTPSFNRYAEWLRLMNQATGKRWVLWQIPLGNSNHLNVYNNRGPREGYKDNRAEYFFGEDGDAHRRKFANAGVISLLFGAGATGQSTHGNDFYTDGRSFMQSRAGAFLNAGGLGLPAEGTTLPPSGSTPPPTDTPKAPVLTAQAASSPTSVEAGTRTTFSVTLTNTGAALEDGVVNLEVHDAAGARVAQRFFEGQRLAAGATSSPYTFDWTTPATAGTYTLHVGVFGAGWSPLHLWSADAATLTATVPVPTDASKYGFESGTQGWNSGGGQVGAVSSSADRAAVGVRSLKVPFTGTSGSVNVSVGSPAVPAGRTVAFRVWIPTGSRITAVHPYLQEGAAGGWRWTGTWRSLSQLEAGAWNTLTVTLPAGGTSPLHQLGVQFTTSGGWAGAAYVDGVTW